MEAFFKDITIDFLLKTPAGETFSKAAAILENSLNIAAGLSDIECDQHFFKQKIGTVLTIALLKLAAQRKSSKDITLDDWKHITEDVSEFAVNRNGQQYSIFVFQLYAAYIGNNAELLNGLVPEEKIAAIKAIADNINLKTELLQTEQISEVEYIEDCLWLSLEAMVKFLAAFTGSKLCSEYAVFIEGASAFAFEYARYALWEKELELVTEYLNNQKSLDEALEKKFEAYIQELQANSDAMNALISDAFDPNFHDKLSASVKLAQAAGVKQEEILDSAEKIDDFFLN